jgi:hypothetical protein
MELEDRALPLTRRQLLDIWLAQETGHSGTEWQLGLFVRIEGTVKPDLLEQGISKAMREAEPCRAAFFEVEFAAAANHKEFLRTAYISYRDTQRRQLANVLRDIADERAPASLINETVHLIETGVLGMSMQRPFISRTQLPGRLRRVYSHGHLTLHRPIGIGVIMTSNTRHSDRAANGRRRVGSTRRSQQANRIRTCLRNHRVRRG